VERVTYHNAENGFCVLRVKARGHKDLVTVVGHAATIAAGEWVQLSGTWVNDCTHGLQFRAGLLKASLPTTLEGIECYLGSGMIRGIGPVYAKKLVRAFGNAVFDLIEAEPGRLREVTGIGPKRASLIVAGWAEQKVIREIMLFPHARTDRARSSRRIWVAPFLPYRDQHAGKAGSLRSHQRRASAACIVQARTKRTNGHLPMHRLRHLLSRCAGATRALPGLRG
jgi:ATP-dependent exoDNAse (exonuclease V) alpha subunit